MSLVKSYIREEINIRKQYLYKITEEMIQKEIKKIILELEYEVISLSSRIFAEIKWYHGKKIRDYIMQNLMLSTRRIIKCLLEDDEDFRINKGETK